MTDRDMAPEGVERRLVENLGDQAHIFTDHDLRAVPHGDASGFLTAVLQRVKPEIGELGHLFPRGPNPENAAGVSWPFLAGKKIVTEPSVWAWHAGSLRGAALLAGRTASRIVHPARIVVSGPRR
jgi:hypothetical protein